MGNAKAHQRYTLKSGLWVPGASTVSGLKAKPFLIIWANRMGLQGIDTRKYVDDKAACGTLAHEMALSHFTGKEVDTSDFTKNQIDQAENSHMSFLNWLKNNPRRPVRSILNGNLMLEVSFVSETHKFGGTIDGIFECEDGSIELNDYKTGKAIYDDHFIQAAGYAQLAIEQGISLNAIRIVNIPRAEDEMFEQKSIRDWSNYWDIFKGLLQVYWAERRIKGTDQPKSIVGKVGWKKKGEAGVLS